MTNISTMVILLEEILSGLRKKQASLLLPMKTLGYMI